MSDSAHGVRNAIRYSRRNSSSQLFVQVVQEMVTIKDLINIKYR